MNYFAVDLGASSGRTVLGTYRDGVIHMQELTRFPNHLLHVGDNYYWDIHELYRNIVCGLTKAAAIGPVDSIGIDTWGVDFVCVGHDGKLLRQPSSYRDPWTDGAPEAFFSRLPRSRVYDLTGIQVMNFNSLFRFDMMRRNRDSAFMAADKILFMPDALSYLLTGNMVCEYTIASTAQIVNARNRSLEPELLEAVGLDESCFGEFVFPGHTVGTLLPQIQAVTGLGPVPVIAVAGHDTASAVAAVPASTSDFAYLSAGTWSLMGVETRQPVINGEMEKLNYTNEGGVNGTIRVLKNICGMWLLERCRMNWGNVSYDTLVKEAQSAPAMKTIIDPDAPEFANPADMEAAIKDYCVKNGLAVPASRGEVVRAIYESLAVRYSKVLADLRHLTGKKIDTLHIIGGGSRNDLLNQWTADHAGVRVVAGPAEATAMGNIMVQAIAAGEAPDISYMRRMVAADSELKVFEPDKQ